jgi:hypothetical protein
VHVFPRSTDHAESAGSDPDSQRVVEIDWGGVLSRVTAVPFLRIRAGRPALFAIVSKRGLDALAQAPFTEALDFQVLGGEPQTTTMVLLQVTSEQIATDGALREFADGLRQRGLVMHEMPNKGLLIAFPSRLPEKILHPPRAGAGHGHTQVLIPDLSFLNATARRVSLQPRTLRSEERRAIENIDAALLSRLMESSVRTSPQEER